MIEAGVVQRVYEQLVREIRERRPEYLTTPFTVAEIYKELIPYRTHRDRLGVEINGDYEHALLELLAGHDDLLQVQSDHARERMAEELESRNPNTALFHEYAALDVVLNPDRIPVPDAGSAEAAAAPEEAGTPPDATDRDERAPLDGASRPTTDLEPEEKHAVVSERSTTCRWCEKQLPDRENLRFCPFCGKDASIVPCGSCGEEVEADWQFCIVCGTDVDRGS